MLIQHPEHAHGEQGNQMAVDAILEVITPHDQGVVAHVRNECQDNQDAGRVQNGLAYELADRTVPGAGGNAAQQVA